MSTLRSILDRINDVEATIASVLRDGGTHPSVALRLSLESLENRRDMLKSEFIEVSQREFIDVCDYKLIPDDTNAYALSAVTTAWHDFQDILSLVFSSIRSGEPKASAKISQDVAETTRLNFGYAYAGSLGIVLTIPNDRFLLSQSQLDSAVQEVFKILESRSNADLVEVKSRFGTPVVRKLHSLSKAHSSYGLGADVKWLRDGLTVDEVTTQAPEFAEICRLIEDESDVTFDPQVIYGTLVAWNTKTKTFVLEGDNGEFVSGRWSEDFDGAVERTIPAPYRAELTKKTVVRYAEDRDIISWVLNKLD